MVSNISTAYRQPINDRASDSEHDKARRKLQRQQDRIAIADGIAETLEPDVSEMDRLSAEFSNALSRGDDPHAAFCARQMDALALYR